MEQDPGAGGGRILRTLAVVAALYLAQSFLILIALAVVIGLALSPVVDRFTRVGLRRTPAIALSVMLSLGILGLGGWLVTGQLAGLARKLPEYRDPIIAKTHALGPVGGLLRESFRRFEETVGRATGGEKGGPSPAAAEKPADPRGAPSELGNPLDTLKNLARLLFGTLGSLIIILVLLVLFLTHQKDLGQRLQGLFQRHGIAISGATLAEAGGKVSRYLLTEFAVNLIYGGIILLATWVLNVPQPLFWGLLAFLFRFIPYIGTWLVAALVLALSLAQSPSWTIPAILLAFWFALELLTADVVEPWVYGKRMGITSLGVMVSALFWSWLWGIAGLMIATPLTACLVELGTEIPALGWLRSLLGALPPSPILAGVESSGETLRDPKRALGGISLPPDSLRSSK